MSKPEDKKSRFQDVPDALIQRQILPFLDDKEILRTALVNKQFNQNVKKAALFSSLIISESIIDKDDSYQTERNIKWFIQNFSKNNRNLTELNLCSINEYLNKDIMRLIIKVFPNLKKIELYQPSYKPQDFLNYLKELKQLQHLNFLCYHRDSNLDEEGFAVLQNINQLRVLKLDFYTSNQIDKKNSINNALTNALKNMKLEIFKIKKGCVDDQIFPYLSDMPLHGLILPKSDITDDSVPYLKKMTGLKILDLGDCNITNFSFLENMNNLTELSLYKSRITDAAVPYLKNMTKLKILDLGDCNITNFSFLKNMNNLKKLYLHDSKMTNDDTYYLEGLTELELLDLTSREITNFSFLAYMPYLKGLFAIDKNFTSYTNYPQRSGVLEFMSAHGITPINIEEIEEYKSTTVSLPKKKEARLLSINCDYENKDIDKILPLSLSGYDEVFILKTINTRYGITNDISENLRRFKLSSQYESIVIPIRIYDNNPKKCFNFCGLFIQKEKKEEEEKEKKEEKEGQEKTGYKIVYFDPRGKRDQHFSEEQRRAIEKILIKHGITGRMQVTTNVIQRYGEFEPDNNSSGPYVISILSRLAAKDIEVINDQLFFKGKRIHMDYPESKAYAKAARDDFVTLLKGEYNKSEDKDLETVLAASFQSDSSGEDIWEQQELKIPDSSYNQNENTTIIHIIKSKPTPKTEIQPKTTERLEKNFRGTEK